MQHEANAPDRVTLLSFGRAQLQFKFGTARRIWA